MARVSIIIPSRNERFLKKTVEDIYAKAAGEVEVIAVLDGYWPLAEELPAERPSLHYLHWGRARGMRAGINAAASIARGEFLMKLDGHCLLSEGFDSVLQADCDTDWLAIPRRYSLDAEAWAVKHEKQPVDYEYLRWPYFREGDLQMSGTVWLDRAGKRKSLLIDDNMSFQGSCWFMHKAYFERLGGMQEEGYGTFIAEAQDLGNRVWLSGGRVITNKNAYYAHLHKGRQYGRGYSLDSKECQAGHHYCVDFWLGNRWSGQVRRFAWLIDHFWPVPTWPETWRELLAERGYAA